MPSAAPIDSRIPTAAFRGTSSERNASMSTTKMRPITTTITHGRRSVSCLERSMSSAVGAGDVDLDVVGGLHGGKDVTTHPFEKVLVAASAGPVRGTACTRVVSPAGLEAPGSTNPTFGSAPTAEPMSRSAAAAWASESPAWSTTISSARWIPVRIPR